MSAGAAATFWRLLRFRLRRDRTQLIVWGLALFACSIVFVADVANTYGTATARGEAITAIATVTPAVMVFRGTPEGAGLAQFTALEVMTTFAVLTGLMSTFLVVRHTRAEEERGQAETVASTAAGRLTPSLAVAALALIANLVAAVAIALGAAVMGLPLGGSILFGAALGASGLAFAGIAFVFAQLMPTSRSANAWAAVLVFVAYFVRGIGDAAGTFHPQALTLTPAGISWASPIGWAQATLPWAQDRVWPLLPGLAAFVALTALALAIQDRRDTGAGVVAERRGRLEASGVLRGPFGLAIRLERGSLLGWIIGLIAFAAVLGGLGSTLVTQLDQASPDVTAAITKLGGSGTLIQSFVRVGAGFSGIMAAAICVQGAIRLRQEEADAHADAVVSTPVGRVRWALSLLLASAVGAAVALALGGLVAGAAAGPKGGGLAEWFGALMWELPAVLVFLGVIALVWAVAPRATAAVGWAVFAVGAILGEFGAAIGFPEWVRDLAPFTHSPNVGVPDVSYAGGWIMAALAVVLVVAAVLLFRRRGTKPVA